MKSSSHSFVRFFNLYRVLNKDVSSGIVGASIHQEAVAILAFVSLENEMSVYPTITKVVQQIDFGTPPTIQLRLKELFELGFLEISEGDDKRHRLLRVTVKGEAYLASCSELLKTALERSARGCGC